MKLLGLVFVVIVFLAFAAPSRAGDPIVTEKCRTVCAEAGADDMDECVRFCGEYVTDPGGSIENLEDGGAPGGWGCYFKLVYYCGKSKEGIALIETLITCIKDGFSSSCFKKNMCKFSEKCLDTACECAGGDDNGCKRKMKKICKDL